MKTLVLYYSRTGTTKILAELIAKELNCDLEEIIDRKNRQGAVNWLIAGKDAFKNRLTEINDIKKDLKMHDLIIIGTPVWAGTITPAIRSFLEKYKHEIKNIAFFSTMGGENPGKTFSELEKVSGKKPLAILPLRTKEVRNNQGQDKIKDFVKEINQNKKIKA